MPLSSNTKSKTLRVASRASPLSRVQVEEVFLALREYHPEVEFVNIYMTTVGDRDLKTSLRSLDKTDFFTRDIDLLQLGGGCEISVHSAKDLPDPLPEGLVVVAVTSGLDSSNSLVLAEGMSFEELPVGGKIATSSQRRDENVRRMRSDLQIVDIRGNIGERLAKLDQGLVDGVVIAEAALIRLGLTHLNRVRLEGESSPLQGKLAVIAREGDALMAELFACLETQVLC